MNTKPTQFLAKKELNVLDESALMEMKEYLVEQYQGIEVPHSFVDHGDSVIDCIPIEQQLSVKKAGQKVMDAPDIPADISTIASKIHPLEDRKSMPVEAPLKEGHKDRFGNAMFCPPGTIPKRRITLEELSRFKTLKDYFKKSPLQSSMPPSTIMKSDIKSNEIELHKYAHAYQQVANEGGFSIMSVHKPAINTNNGEIFSLSQHWYAGESPIQTVEVGWQVYPLKYGTTLPVLFIYWTADNYQNTGCYNLDCSAFVQTSNLWILGGALDFSEIILSFWLLSDKWWLYAGVGNSTKAIGYYPVSIFKGGPLSSKATSIDYGGETVGEKGSWPPMGSGAFGHEGMPKAAYHRNIGYFSNGGLKSANLTRDDPSPKCYDTKIEVYQNWKETLYYGGPGGTGC